MLNQKGQGLIEYLILVSLMAVATMGVVSVLNHSVRGKFVQIIDAVQSRKTPTKVQFEKTEESDAQKRDMSNFMRGSARGR